MLDITSGGIWAPPREAKPMRMIGTQQKKSVATINVIRRAMALKQCESMRTISFIIFNFNFYK